MALAALAVTPPDTVSVSGEPVDEPSVSTPVLAKVVAELIEEALFLRPKVRLKAVFAVFSVPVCVIGSRIT